MLTQTNDIKKIKELDDIIFGQSSYSTSTYEIMLNNNLFYFITNKNEIIGFIVIQRVGDDYELIKVGILSEHRHHGYAYGALLEILSTFSYETFLLEVKGCNKEAIGLYQKLGFELSGYRKDYYSPGIDAILMKYTKNTN